jgi:ferric-dicitrate binding protein FerR (iron transport regulator)
MAAVRDTLFQVTVLGDDTTTVRVKKGSVAVTGADQELLVRPGEETTAQPGGLPITPTVSPAPKSQFGSDSIRQHGR